MLNLPARVTGGMVGTVQSIIVPTIPSVVTPTDGGR